MILFFYTKPPWWIPSTLRVCGAFVSAQTSLCSFSLTHSHSGKALRGNRNDFGVPCFRNLLVVEPNNFVVWPNTINQYRYHDRVSAPRYTINKSKCKNSNKHIRFYRFVNCVFSYSPCISCWLSPTKTVVF